MAQHQEPAAAVGVRFDTNTYFARSGLCDGSRYDAAAPDVSMPAQGDRRAGVALAAGIMIALWNRERIGRGCKVASPRLANGIWANGDAVQAALLNAPLLGVDAEEAAAPTAVGALRCLRSNFRGQLG